MGTDLTWKNETGEWGVLSEEPCRYCYEIGGVQFLLENRPGEAGVVIVHCKRCHRTWEA